MRRIVYGACCVILCLISASPIFSQVTTTASINGRVTQSENPLPGANITAIHVPTGSRFTAHTNSEGVYKISNLNVGGPYTVIISFMGYESVTYERIYLNLGQTLSLDAVLVEGTVPMKDVEVVVKRNDVLDGNTIGAETVVNLRRLSALPTIGRYLTDITRMTPQAIVGDNELISVAGANSRYNSISIDGAVNNDVFGLAGNSTIGGQTGGKPISLDAIEQLRVAVAPFDVRENGFTGASINAVTRSGSNEFTGSLYRYVRNDDIAGKTPGGITLPPGADREKLPDFSSKTHGVRIGGPVLRDKLFFFTSIEIQRDESPQPFSLSSFQGISSESDLNTLIDRLKTDYGYDPGGYSNGLRKLYSDKFFGRLDWNISPIHKLTVRHSYTKNEATIPFPSNSWTLNFSNSGIYFPSVANSFAAELRSNFDKASNNLILGFTRVREDREPIGTNFPTVRISDGWATINVGSEAYSTADQLKQDIFSITDNVTFYRGNHTITAGMSSEYYAIDNVAIFANFGEYSYASVNDFLNDAQPARYARNYSLLSGAAGDASDARARFKAMRLGFYIQDQLNLNSRMRIKYGLRMDIPVFLEHPSEDTYFNTTTIPLIEQAGYDLEGARAGKMPGTKLLFSPRFGFNYAFQDDRTTQLRGGIGVFTARLPLAWPAGSYVNNGMSIGVISIGNPQFMDGTPLNFNPDPFNQPDLVDFTGNPGQHSGQIDIYAKDFKYPRVLRFNVAVDQQFPKGILGSLDILYSKTLQNVNYINLNIPRPTQHLTGQGGADTRPIYNWGRIDPNYTDIILCTNTSKGYAYSVTAHLQKSFQFGLEASLAYTYGRAKALNDGRYDRNSWQWAFMEQVNGRNNPEYSYSVFDMGSRLVGYLSHTFSYSKNASTSIALFYSGQSGRRYSYTYGNGQLMQQETWSLGNDLIYVPAGEDEINLVDIGTSGSYDYVSAHDQWVALDTFIGDDPYLSERRGRYAERNGATLPFEHIFDVRLSQDLTFRTGSRSHTFQFTFDIFNVTNLLKKDWGQRFSGASQAYSLIQFEGFEADGSTPRFTFRKPTGEIYTIDDAGVNSSRWQAQFGIRYFF